MPNSQVRTFAEHVLHARLNLAILYQKQNRFEDAARNYRLAIEFSPGDFSAH